MKHIFMLLVVISLLFSGCQSDSADMIIAKKLIEYHAHKYNDLPASGILENGIRTIKIEAYQFYFSPKQVIVNKGERVRLIIEAMDIPHGFEIEGFMIMDYDINTVIRPGQPLTLEFDATEEGVWEFICSIYCGYGHSNMKGEFVVRELP